MVNLILDSEIIEAFASVGITLSYFPADSDHKTALWQYDGGLEGQIIELWVGINGLGVPGVFGNYHAANLGNSYRLACTMSDWLEAFSKDLPKMAKGEELDW